MLRKALATLPRTLNDTYARILSNIDEDYQQYALHILQWLAFSARPMHLKEICEVVAIDVNENPQFDPQRRLRDPQDVVEICSSLITLTHRSSGNTEIDQKSLEYYGSIIILAHFSVKGYLTSDIILQGQAVQYSLQEIDCHVSLAKDCLAYLLHIDEVSALPSGVFIEYPLALYVAKNWTKHAPVAEKRDYTLCQDFFLTKGEAFNNWTRRELCNLTKPAEMLPSRLNYAASAGLCESVRLLLDKGADINAKGGPYDYTLRGASRKERPEMVRFLLEKDVHVNTPYSWHGNALQIASSRGHIEMVQILLEKGADANAQGGKDGSALFEASYSGHVEIVQMLLEEGADVNARGQILGRSGTALEAAIETDNEEVARLLIENKADVSRVGGPGRDPLELASYKGFHKVVELILTRLSLLKFRVRDIAEHWQRLREDAKKKWSRYCSTRVPSSTLKRWKPQDMEKEQMFCRCYLSMEVTQACRIDRVELAAIMHLLKLTSQNLNCSSSLSKI